RRLARLHAFLRRRRRQGELPRRHRLQEVGLPRDRAAERGHPGARRLRGRHRAGQDRVAIGGQAEDAQQPLHQCVGEEAAGLADGGLAVDPASRVKLLLVTAWLLFAATPVQAQGYPDHPIRFYVGFPPGGSTDLISRLLGQKLSERLKQPVIVEQKVGGTGLIANDAVAKSPPDGHTMVLLTGGHPGTAAVMKKLPYDPVNDFGMVSTVIEYPMVISVAPESPIKSFGELVARAKASPGRISFSSAGPGSLHHLLGEWLSIEAGTTLLHVPFKGAAPAYTELLGGRIDILIETATFSF